MARRSIVELVIQAQDKASQKIDGVSKSAGGLGKAGAAAAIGVGALGAAFAALQTAGAVVDMVKAADSAQRLETSFERLAESAESSASDMLGAMKRMSGGAISETDLILSANKAMMLGVADSADELSQLMEVAIERGAAMGLSAEQAFNDLVTGIGRMSPLILDNLGIVTGGEAVFEAYASSIGKTADALSDAEKKQALFNVVAKDTDGTLDVTVSSFERLDVAVSEAKIALGELFAPAVIAGAEALVTAIDTVTEDIEQMQETARQNDTAILANSIALLEAEVVRASAAMNAAAEGTAAYYVAQDQLEGATAALAAAQTDLIPALQSASQETLTFSTQLDALRAKAFAAAQATDALTSATLSYGSAAIAYDVGATYDPALERAQASIRGLGSGLVSDLGAGGVLDFIEKGTEKVIAQKAAWEALGYEPKFINDVLLPGYVSSLDDGIRKTAQLGSATEKVSSEYSNLESTVSGILSGAIGPVAGVNAEDFLPREDEINENARRLADIMVNGLTGQDWLAEFAAEAPDVYAALASAGDPQAAAASLLRDFQDGLRPDLIDKDRAKELVKRAILGDQETAALAQEIAGELAAELGVSLQEATAAASSALGVSGGDGGGTGALTEGMVQSVDGGAVVDALVTSIAAKFDSLVAAGSEAGKQWGAGFMAAVGDNVPEPLISLLANLVTPGVMAQLNTNSGLTGADS